MTDRKEYMRLYYLKNKDKFQENNKKYFQENKDEIMEKRKTDEGKEKRKVYKQNYYYKKMYNERISNGHSEEEAKQYVQTIRDNNNK
jgi:hypothetical protein